MSIFINELSNAVKVTKDIYTLQRQISDNAPATELDIIGDMTEAKSARSEREKQKRLEDLKRQVLSIKGGSSYYTDSKDGSNIAKPTDYELVEVIEDTP
jgi:predicted nucleic acid-binding Zn ribbon protein